MKNKQLCIAFLFSFCFTATGLISAPSIGTTQASPNAIGVGVPTKVTVTSFISDPTLIATSVNLLRINADGSSVILGQLNDSGVNGDVTAGDKTFTGTVTFDEAQTGQIQLQVSAAFKGMLKRVLSAVTTITVADSVSVLGPLGGTLAIQDSTSPLFGLTLIIPQGALSADTQIAIARPPIPPPLPDNLLAVGPSFQLLPSGLSFSLPISIAMPFNDSNHDGLLDGTLRSINQLAAVTSQDLVTWTPLTVDSIDSTNNLLHVQTNHFSTLATVLTNNSFSIKWNMVSTDLNDNNSSGAWIDENGTNPTQVKAITSSDPGLAHDAVNATSEAQDNSVVDLNTRAGTTDKTKTGVFTLLR